jgi:two-component system CheB/CheR fusion protein
MSPHQQPVRALRICVVENHSDTRHMLSVLLRQQGHELGLAESCAAARALFDAEAFDVLISDIGLPDGDGWQLLQDLAHRQARPLFAIAISGYGTSVDHSRSLASGYRYHLVKPVALASLIPLLHEAADSMGVVAPG